jgi:hypothetical protein
LARRISSIRSEFVNVIASVMNASIVYKQLLQAGRTGAIRTCRYAQSTEGPDDARYGVPMTWPRAKGPCRW